MSRVTGRISQHRHEDGDSWEAGVTVRAGGPGSGSRPGRRGARRWSRLLVGVPAALVVLVGVLPGVAAAADPYFPGVTANPVAGYGEPPVGQVVTDVQVITGDNPDINCPDGYVKRQPDLNTGLGTQVGGGITAYVYTCLRFQPAGTLGPGNAGIGELYVTSKVTANCNGDDQQVDGNLNEGMHRVNIEPGYDLHFCIHRPGTNGGSGRIPNPGEGYTSYFPTPANQVLSDVQFMYWQAGSVPGCDTTDCVDTSPAGAFGYLEVAQTYDPYCQKYFGSAYHPLFRPFEYHSWSGDRGAAVPADAESYDLNAGELGKTQIFACGAYVTPDTTPPTITATATTDAGTPYVAGDWTRQVVHVTFTCTDQPGGSGVDQVSGPQSVSTSTYGRTVSGQCSDKAGNVARTSFGPIRVDRFLPLLDYTATTPDGQHYRAGTWTNQDVTVGFSCADDGDVQSGIATDTVGGGRTVTEEVYRGLVSSTGDCIDRAGNGANGPLDIGPIDIDKTKPVVTASATTADGKPYVPGTWTGQDVTVAFRCADAGAVQSGIATNTVTGATLGEGNHLAVPYSGSCADRAGNVADPVSFGPVLVDHTAPAITLTSPAGTVYLLAQKVAAAYSCTDLLADGVTPGSGVSTCAGPVASGQPFDTASVGGKSFRVGASDRVGNTSSSSVDYQVTYRICGLDHVGDRAHEPGSALPLQLTLCTADGTAVPQPGTTVTAGTITAADGGTRSAQAKGNANPGNTFRYDGGQYSYQLDTTGLAAGTYTLTFGVTGDPVPHRVGFQLASPPGQAGQRGAARPV